MIELKGYRTSLEDLLRKFSRQELLADAVSGKLMAEDWTEKTTLKDKYADFLSIKETYFDNVHLKLYLQAKKNEAKQVDFQKIGEMLKAQSQQIKELFGAINGLSALICETHEKLGRSKFVDLDEIADAFKTGDGAIYAKGSLRNKIVSEKAYNGTLFGILDVPELFLHLHLVKLGNKWVANRSHWLEQKTRLADYDLRIKLGRKTAKYRVNRHKKDDVSQGVTG